MSTRSYDSNVKNSTPNSNANNVKHSYYFENPLELMQFGKMNGVDTVWLRGDNYLKRFFEGYRVYSTGNFRQAIQIYQDCLLLNPVGLRARFEICECYLQLKQYIDAKQTLMEIVPYLEVVTDVACASHFYGCMAHTALGLHDHVLALNCWFKTFQYPYNEQSFFDFKTVRQIPLSGFERVDKPVKVDKVIDEYIKKHPKQAAETDKKYPPRGQRDVDSILKSNGIPCLRLNKADSSSTDDATPKATTSETPKPVTSTKSVVQTQKPLQQQKVNITKVTPEQRIAELKKKYPLIDGTGYSVSVLPGEVKKPTYCLHCLEKTVLCAPIGSSGVTMPICQKCIDEKNRALSKYSTEKDSAEKEMVRTAGKKIIGSAFCSILIMMIAFIVVCIYLSNLGVCCAISAMSGMLLYLLLSNRKVTYKAPTHTVFLNKRNGGFVEYTKEANGKQKFIFTNGAYAELFAEANNSKVFYISKAINDPVEEKTTRRSAARIKHSSAIVYLLILMIIGGLYYSVANYPAVFDEVVSKVCAVLPERIRPIGNAVANVDGAENTAALITRAASEHETISVEPAKGFEELTTISRGDAVKQMQVQLKELGYGIGVADGIFGQKTGKAVAEFNHNNGIGSQETASGETLWTLYSDGAIRVNDDRTVPYISSVSKMEYWTEGGFFCATFQISSKGSINNTIKEIHLEAYTVNTKGESSEPVRFSINKSIEPGKTVISEPVQLVKGKNVASVFCSVESVEYTDGNKSEFNVDRGQYREWAVEPVTSKATPSPTMKATDKPKTTKIPKATSTPKATSAPKATAKPMEYPQTGHVFYSAYKSRPAEFVLKNHSTAAYYVKFVNLSTNNDAIRFFVRPNSTATVKMPKGTFELRYAAGSTWYGEKDLFGSNTLYSKDKEPYPFEANTRWTCEFQGNDQNMDNMEVKSIPEDQF